MDSKVNKTVNLVTSISKNTTPLFDLHYLYIYLYKVDK